MSRRAALLLATSVLVPVTATAQPEPAPATTPETDAEPEPEPEPDLDLDELAGLDVDTSDGTDQLSIYGFMDFTWVDVIMPKGSPASLVLPDESSFGVGNLNLYLTRALSNRWRSFLEVRFLYTPAGTVNPDGTYVQATGPDPANAYRPTSWGGIGVERAYLEYDVNDQLTVRAGSFLTPYGIWNVDHGSPTIIPTLAPYIIGEELFPKQQTGIQLHGKRVVGDYAVGYHATVSNGRGPFQSFRDLDDNRAIGGRLELAAPWLGSTRIGISGYRGRYTDRPAPRIQVGADGSLSTVTPLGTSYDEASFGADLLVERGALRIQAEALMNTRRYRAGARALSDSVFVPDNRYLGTYVLAGYRLDRWWQAMPFVELEADSPRVDPVMGSFKTYAVVSGVNLRPVPNVTLKANHVAAKVTGTPRFADFLQVVAVQAAWAF